MSSVLTLRCPLTWYIYHATSWVLSFVSVCVLVTFFCNFHSFFLFRGHVYAAELSSMIRRIITCSQAPIDIRVYMRRWLSLFVVSRVGLFFFFLLRGRSSLPRVLVRPAGGLWSGAGSLSCRQLSWFVFCSEKGVWISLAQGESVSRSQRVPKREAESETVSRGVWHSRNWGRCVYIWRWPYWSLSMPSEGLKNGDYPLKTITVYILCNTTKVLIISCVYCWHLNGSGFCYCVRWRFLWWPIGDKTERGLCRPGCAAGLSYYVYVLHYRLNRISYCKILLMGCSVQIIKTT